MLVLLLQYFFHQPYLHGVYLKTFLCLFPLFLYLMNCVHNRIANIISLHAKTMVVVYILLLPYTYHTYTPLCRAVNTSMSVTNSPVRLRVQEKVVQHSLHNHPSINYAIRWSNTYFSAPRGRMSIPGASWLKKVDGRESLAFLHTVRKQQSATWFHKRCMAVLIGKRQPAVQYTKLIEQRERQSKHNVHCNTSSVNSSLTMWPTLYVASRTAQLVVSNCFPINYSLYESQSLCPLHTSRCSVFILDLP